VTATAFLSILSCWVALYQPFLYKYMMMMIFAGWDRCFLFPSVFDNVGRVTGRASSGPLSPQRFSSATGAGRKPRRNRMTAEKQPLNGGGGLSNKILEDVARKYHVMAALPI